MQLYPPIRRKNISRPLKSAVKLLTYLFLAVFFINPGTAGAQNELSRISVAQRSDGLGYVVRYHFSSAPDSFKIFQPRADLIQLAVYKNGVDIAAATKPDAGTALLGFDLHTFPNGFGTDIRLSQGKNYLARAYPDANQTHLLVGLTEISAREMQLLTDGQNLINWNTVNSIPRQTLGTDTLTLTSSIDSLRTIIDDLQSSTPETGLDQPVSGTRPDDSLSAPLTHFQGRVSSNNTRLRTIVLDAGHGGHDPGSIGSGHREKDIALSVTKKLGAYINQHLPDINVIYTRDNDRFIQLEERGSIANRARGDLFVSIHTNSARSRQAYGAEVYFLGMARTESAIEVMKKENNVILLEDPESRSRDLTEEELILYELNNIGYMSASQRLAELVDRQFTDRAQRRSRGVKQAGFIVLYHASMPAILVELGFISNPAESQYLASESGQNILASAIFRAIREYKELIEH